MDRISLALLLFSILTTLLMATLLGMLWAWVWMLDRIWNGLPIMANDRAWPLRPARWGGLTVLALVLLYLGVNVFVTGLYAVATGRHPPLAARAAENHVGAREPGKAIDQPKTAKQTPAAKEPAASGQGKDLKAGLQAPALEDLPEQSLAELMFQSAVSNGLLLVLVPLFVRFSSAAGLADLGLHGQEWPRQMGIGVRAALLMTPPVCAVQFLAVRIWHPQAHPVELMVLEKLTPGVAILAVLSTMVLAPFVEELLFRGILQRWLGRFGQDQPLPANRVQEDEDKPLPSNGIREDDWSATQEPVSESILYDSKYAPPRSTPASPASQFWNRGDQPVEPPPERSSNMPILITSVFFAALHVPQWPAPIAIFLLSIALGAVYQRTGSLLASISMHATFNGINTLLLLLAALGERM